MTAPDASRLHVTIHLQQQSTVSFDSGELWPRHGVQDPFGDDLPSFAEEVARRLQADGYIGYSVGSGKITVIPMSSVKRIDFAIDPVPGR